MELLSLYDNRINYFGVTHLINWIIDLFNHDRFE